MRNPRSARFIAGLTFLASVAAPAASSRNVGIVRIDGTVYAFRAKGADLEWIRCEDFGLADESNECRPRAAKTLPVAFYQAAFWRWLRGASAAKTGLTSADLATIRQIARQREIAAGFADLNARKNALMNKIDFYRKNFPGSPQEKAVQSDYAEVEKKLKVVAAAKARADEQAATSAAAVAQTEKILADAIAQIKAAAWATATGDAKSPSLAFLKDLAPAFEKPKMKDVTAASASAPTGWASVVARTVGFGASENGPILAISYYSQAFCLYDPQRKNILQCADRNGNPIVVPQTVLDALSESPLAKMSGSPWSSGFYLQTEDGQILTLEQNPGVMNTTADNAALANFKTKGLRLLANGYQTPSVPAIRIDGSDLLVFSRSNEGLAEEFKLSGEVRELTLPFYQYFGFAGCWIGVDGKIQCGLGPNVGGNATYHFPITSGAAPTEVQLDGVNRLAIATSAHSNELSPILCSANDSDVACVFRDGKSFKVEADASRGLYAFIDSSSSGTYPSAGTVCAIGAEEMKCFQGGAATPIQYQALPRKSDEIVAVSPIFYGACFALKNKIQCTPNAYNLPGASIPLKD